MEVLLVVLSDEDAGFAGKSLVQLGRVVHHALCFGNVGWVLYRSLLLLARTIYVVLPRIRVEFRCCLNAKIGAARPELALLCTYPRLGPECRPVTTASCLIKDRLCVVEWRDLMGQASRIPEQDHSKDGFQGCALRDYWPVRGVR